ncbi:MAG: response regulator transcription factor [Pleurocapsa sp.]
MYTNQNNFPLPVPAIDVIKILLVDDQKFVQHKLQQMLSSRVDLQIVGLASDGETAIAQVESLKPDVVLIDIEMPKMNGIEATKVISQRFPNCKILILSSYEHQEYVQKIIAAGADGYILKTTPTEDLVTAIHSVGKGYSHFGSQLFKKIQLAPNVDRSSKINSPQVTASLDNYSSIRQSDSQQLASNQADDLLPPVSQWLTKGGISVVMLIVLAIPAASVFKYKTVVRASAIVRPVTELHLVQAAVEGQISQILVKEAQNR